MSTPYRPPGSDRSHNGKLSKADRAPVSPIPYPEEHDLSHGHPLPLKDIPPVEPAPGQQQSWFPRRVPPQWNHTRSAASATPGVDNLSPAAVGGGIGGIALGIANSHDRQSAIDARQSLEGTENDRFIGPVERGYHTTGSDNPYVPAPPEFPGYASSDSWTARDSYGSNLGLSAGAAPAGQAASGRSTPRVDQFDPSRRSLLDRQSYPYPAVPQLNDGPYQRNSAYNGTNEIAINPDEIEDDGDDGIPMSDGRNPHSAARAAAGGAAARAGLGAFGGMRGSYAGNPAYGPVPGGGLEGGEKNRWVQPKPSGRSRRRGWICGAILAFIIVGAIVGGAVGGIVGNRHRQNPRTDTMTAKGDLGKGSSEIKDVMNNENLHKVFPGVDYTPWGVQYPLCEKYPPLQNNVTLDMAVLSQLTNTVRLYGTDCNQTEMVLHAIDQLELKEMKLWLGVWIDSNDTTVDRQLRQLYKIIDDAKDLSIFKGVIVGNEALFRAGPDINSARVKLIGYLNDVRDEFKKRNVDLLVATSDLGDNWDGTLAEASDLVMSNIHPFFAGVPADEAASWAYGFWKTTDLPLTNGNMKKQVISETGWPSGGGNDCGASVQCPNNKAGSVAGIDEMNQYMSDWVCQALDNGTDYFWFEAFDEPWKVIYNEPGRAWEDKWGLMDASRKLKPGLKIPDCGGKTVS